MLNPTTYENSWPWLHVTAIIFTICNTGLLFVLLGLVLVGHTHNTPTVKEEMSLFLPVVTEAPSFTYVPPPPYDYSDHPTKAVRLNNPGNVMRHPKIVWAGAAPAQKDKTLCTFSSPEYGIRAIGKILLTYQTRYNCDTISKIITRYAPPHENKTEEYAAFVASKVGVGVDSPIDVKECIVPFVSAIMEYETGTGDLYPQEAFTLLAEGE